MATYSVSLPISGIIVVEVEAADEESAIEAALDSHYSDKDIEQWEAHREICRGNVFCGEQNEAEATLVSSEGEGAP